MLFNNLVTLPSKTFVCPADEDGKARLALDLDRAMRQMAPADWKGDEIREREVINAIYPIMSKDREATRAIFDIIKNQSAY